MVHAEQILKEVYQNANRLFGTRLREAYLYGSYARGDFTSESDVDIFLTVDAAPEDLSPYRAAVAAIDSDLSLVHEVTVSTAVQSEQIFRRFADVMPFYQNVLKEGIPYGKP